MNTQIYPTDLTDSQWDYIKELIPAAKNGGRPRILDMRQVINGILYVTVDGIQWRMLPKKYLNWKSVYDYFRIWRIDGTWKRLTCCHCSWFWRHSFVGQSAVVNVVCAVHVVPNIRWRQCTPWCSARAEHHVFGSYLTFKPADQNRQSS